jgi:hypothetical protein
MNDTMTPREKLAVFDETHGHVVLNALETYAGRMREVAAEAASWRQVPKPDPDLRSWLAEDLLVLARAAGILWHSTSREDPLDVLNERQVALLDRAAGSYLAPAETPGIATGSTATINLTPTPGGFARMASMFTEAADTADQAHKAYETLTGRNDPDNEPLDATDKRAPH